MIKKNKSHRHIAEQIKKMLSRKFVLKILKKYQMYKYNRIESYQHFFIWFKLSTISFWTLFYHDEIWNCSFTFSVAFFFVAVVCFVFINVKLVKILLQSELETGRKAKKKKKGTNMKERYTSLMNVSS